MDVYILRHGVTEWNKRKKIQGSADIPLAEEGISLASATGEALKDIPFDLCFTSPLVRARQTAALVLGNRRIPVIEDKRIQEINFGELEGTIARDEEGRLIDERMKLFFEDPLDFERPRDGENISDILERTREFWEELTGNAALQDKIILISTHGCAVRALLQNIYHDPGHFWHGSVPPNCSVSYIQIKEKIAKICYEDRVFG